MEDLACKDRRLTETKARQSDHRTPYQRDRARILHSAAFRRLQAKTQVLGVGMNDFYRTRLTHSLEAAQIGAGIRAQLVLKFPEQASLLDSDPLIESICFAHDLGHPPFGHGGEVALNCMMAKHGGFEGNAQTFRILAKLEPYTPEHGMNLCRRTLLGVLKYPQTLDTLSHKQYPDNAQVKAQIRPSEWHPPKGIYDCDTELLDWVLSPLTSEDQTRFTSYNQQSDKHGKTRYKSMDCSIMELADDIAYGIHDMEDAVVMGIVQRDDWEQHVVLPLRDLNHVWFKKNLDKLSSHLFSQHQYDRKDAIGSLVNLLISSIELKRSRSFHSPLLDYQAVLPEALAKALGLFKSFVYDFVIRKPELQLLEFKGQRIVMSLFEAFHAEPTRLLPRTVQTDWQAAFDQLGESAACRVIADHISGMTDASANRLYQTLFLPQAGSINSQHDL
ncbi:anti-phage deoxyguanosine triphosphatase [Corallincola platygyrae]|uniref:Deoxyguanosinetriphosphate triphosphohydrolase-like protein n=1 Tax=Corallincola platygyrae TaxID=1193278 RepID=A0ABW4XNG4_9GAMM